MPSVLGWLVPHLQVLVEREDRQSRLIIHLRVALLEEGAESTDSRQFYRKESFVLQVTLHLLRNPRPQRAVLNGTKAECGKEDLRASDDVSSNGRHSREGYVKHPDEEKASPVL